MANEPVEPTDITVLQAKAAKMKESDFITIPDSYGNELCVYASDFPELAKEERGAEIMFVVRGVIKSNSDEDKECMPMAAGDDSKPEPKIRMFLFNAALVHGKKSMRLGGGGRFEKMKEAIMGKGMSEERASAIAAESGRKKYGAVKFQKMATVGLHRYFKNK